ncbi:MAG: DUF4271 domain-containing protein [Bacteroidales bacterium]|nr:DUF4271 domain-containing protein [Bacteroidales bacterium]MBN2699192.1 DUF4271 domain-containing protein [Bacteroidales bacterium]
MISVDSLSVAIHSSILQDTLVQADKGPPVFKASQLASHSELPGTVMDQALQAGAPSPDWYFFTMVGLLIFVAWFRMKYGNILLRTVQTSLSFPVTQGMFNDNSILQKHLDNILYGLYFLSFGFYLVVMEHKFGFYPYGLTGFRLYLFNIAFLLALFLGRVLLIDITGHIFNQKNLLREYRYHMFTFNKLTGLIIIPFIFAIIYTNGLFRDILEWTSISLMGILLILRIYRGILFSLNRKVLILHLFLYLCALEMIPLMVLFKWISSIV